MQIFSSKNLNVELWSHNVHILISAVQDLQWAPVAQGLHVNVISFY